MEKEKKETKESPDKQKQNPDKAKQEAQKKEIEDSIKSQLEESQKVCYDKEQKIGELTEMLQRMHAEMQNYKKVCDRESQEYRKYCDAELIGKLLPILDSFELALKNCSNKEDFVKGVELIFSQLYDALEKEGLKPINTKGERFDPYKHEVLLTEKTEKESEDELIVEELQKGYMFKDKVLRYSKVKIKKKS